MNRKIKSQIEISQIVRDFKKQGKKMVTSSGSFDILHIGHIKSLQEAKRQGDVLIVLLNSDKSIKSYKGQNRPINSQKGRAQALAGLECVDYITIFNGINPKKILGKVRPDVHCNGLDWGKNCIERKLVEENSGKIHVLKWSKGLSTTNLIKKILDVYSKPETKAVFLDRDGTINIDDPKYNHKIENFKFAPYVIPALQRLSKSDYKIIVVTNQSGIARGYFGEKDLEKLHGWMLEFLRRKGIKIDKIYYCPHHPKADNKRYRRKCNCRKPGIGMFLKAVKDFNISLNKSWMVGNDVRDIIMGREANVKTIKVGEKMPKELKLEPNYYAENFLQAVKIIQRYNS